MSNYTTDQRLFVGPDGYEPSTLAEYYAEYLDHVERFDADMSQEEFDAMDSIEQGMYESNCHPTIQNVWGLKCESFEEMAEELTEVYATEEGSSDREEYGKYAPVHTSTCGRTNQKQPVSGI